MGKALIGLFLGALALSIITTLYHTAAFPGMVDDGQYALIWLFHTIPTGAALGLATQQALFSEGGWKRAIRCFAGVVLGLVPFGVWAYIQITLDPFRAPVILWEMAKLFVPSFVWLFLLLVGGAASLRRRSVTAEKSDTEN